jgi:hypothetical protein
MRSYKYLVLRKGVDLNSWEQFEQKFKNTVKFKLETNLLIEQSKKAFKKARAYQNRYEY